MLLPTQVGSYYMEADKYQSQPATTENANLQFLQCNARFITLPGVKSPLIISKFDLIKPKRGRKIKYHPCACHNVTMSQCHMCSQFVKLWAITLHPQPELFQITLTFPTIPRNSNHCLLCRTSQEYVPSLWHHLSDFLMIILMTVKT